MRVMLLIKGDPEPGAAPSEELLAAMGRYNDELKQVGVLLDLAGLLPSAEGRRVKFSGGNRAVIGGPFGESKELLAGYWILQVEFDGRGCGMGRAVPVRGVISDLSGRVWRWPGALNIADAKRFQLEDVVRIGPDVRLTATPLS